MGVKETDFLPPSFTSDYRCFLPRQVFLPNRMGTNAPLLPKEMPSTQNHDNEVHIVPCGMDTRKGKHNFRCLGPPTGPSMWDDCVVTGVVTQKARAGPTKVDKGVERTTQATHRKRSRMTAANNKPETFATVLLRHIFSRSASLSSLPCLFSNFLRRRSTPCCSIGASI